MFSVPSERSFKYLGQHPIVAAPDEAVAQPTGHPAEMGGVLKGTQLLS